jgi:uroporphyrinogen-III synthase
MSAMVAPMKIWVTRAEPGASRTAERLRALGHEPLVAPVLQVHTLSPEIDLGGVGALAFTSANGVRAFAGLSRDRGLPVFAVGVATSEAARAAGFAFVQSADGDVEAMAGAIAGSSGMLAGRVLHPGAAEPAGDLIGALMAVGIAARGVTVYETLILPAVVPPGAEALLIHSPKAARAVTAAAIGKLTAYCISEAAAQPLAGRAKHTLVAAQPNEASLLSLLPV